MNFLVARMKWIMLISGLLTCTMFYVFVAPTAALQATFGESLEGPVAGVIVRNWGALIGLVGLMLIYGAFNAVYRPLVLVVAGASKLIFIALVLSQGSRFLSFQAGIDVAVDGLMVILFAAYLAASRNTPANEVAG